LWLHAEQLQLQHPIHGQPLALHSPLPAEWALWETHPTSPRLLSPSG
jgi:hypothetical protein